MRLVDVFGDDAPRFTGVLAGTSPQTSVQSNLLNSLNIFKNWNASGRLRDPRLADMMSKTRSCWCSSSEGHQKQSYQ